MRKYLAILALAPLMLVAQDLNKEITIDRDIVPEQRAAFRPIVFPSVVNPRISPVDLRMEENANPSELTPMLILFNPAATPEAFPLTPYRGYLDAGYFPTTDFGTSAGFAIINKEKSQLGAWLQVDDNSTDGTFRRYPAAEEESVDFHTIDLTVGVDFAQRFGKFNTLRLSTDFSWSRWDLPLFYGEKLVGINSLPPKVWDHGQNLRWHLNGAFDGRINSTFAYGFSAGGGIFNNLADKTDVDYNLDSNIHYDQPEGGIVNQTSYKFGAWLRGNVSDNASLGVDIDGKFLHFSHFLTPTQFLRDYEMNGTAFLEPSKTIGNVDITPTAEYNGGAFYGKIGARFGISSGSGKSFHVAPDVVLGLNPDDRFGVWLKVGGGVHTNSFEDMFLISRYADQRVAYNLSNIPVNGQFGLRVGPFKGAVLSLTLDYAAANNWLMPLQCSTLALMTNEITGQKDQVVGRGVNFFAPTDLRSWKFGAEFQWSYREWFEIDLSYATTLGSGERHSWLYWADRARHVVSADLSINPGEWADALAVIKPLSIDLGFEGRFSRSQATTSPVKYGVDASGQDYMELPHSLTSYYSLGTFIDLSVGAQWEFNPKFAVFAEFSDILGRNSHEVFNLPSQAFNGAFGVKLKF